MESRSKVREVESENKDSYFECYDNSDGKPVLIYVDKEITGDSQKKTTLALLPTRSEEEEINNTTKTGFRNDNGNVNTSVQRSNQKFKPPEWLGTIQNF